MKSRVINTKYFIDTGKEFHGYCSQLKPSLFYGVPEEENTIWVQSQKTNKMACFKLWVIIGKEKGMKWIYKPTLKYVNKFPELNWKSLIIHFDVWQDTPFARKKRAGLVKKKGWKKRELAEKKKKEALDSANK